MSPGRPEPDRDTVRAMEAQARSRLTVAHELHGMGHFEDSVSRAYYAAFHAATLLLYCAGHTFSSHAQLIGAFNKEFIRTGALPAECARSFRGLYELRQTADYDVQNSLTAAKSEGALKQAEDLVDQLLAYAHRVHPSLFNQS